MLILWRVRWFIFGREFFHELMNVGSFVISLENSSNPIFFYFWMKIFEPNSHVFFQFVTDPIWPGVVMNENSDCQGSAIKCIFAQEAAMRWEICLVD